MIAIITTTIMITIRITTCTLLILILTLMILVILNPGAGVWPPSRLAGWPSPAYMYIYIYIHTHMYYNILSIVLHIMPCHSIRYLTGWLLSLPLASAGSSALRKSVVSLEEVLY